MIRRTLTDDDVTADITTLIVISSPSVVLLYLLVCLLSYLAHVGELCSSAFNIYHSLTITLLDTLLTFFLHSWFYPD